MKLIARLLREPLLHFVVIGGLIFLLFGPVVARLWPKYPCRVSRMAKQ
jgi:hypothetical protein